MNLSRVYIPLDNVENRDVGALLDTGRANDILGL